MKRRITYGIAALVTTLCLATPVFADPVQAPPGDTPFGVYDPDGDFSDNKQVVIEHLFLPWEDVYLPSLEEADKYAKARNRALLVTLEPWTWSRSERNTAQYLRRGIAKGDYDGNMTTVCREFAKLKSPVTLRFAHEMEDTSGQFIWAGWTPEAYISAFRHMIDICRAQAPKISVMWSPLGLSGMDRYYPGDKYVDLVGLSVFGLQAWDRAKFGRDRTFDEVFGPRYKMASKYNKPIVIAELGYVGDAAYVESWKNAVRNEKATYPNLVGVVYFNQREVYPYPEGFGTPDWRIKNQILH